MSIVANYFRTGSKATKFTVWRMLPPDPQDPDSYGGWSNIGSFDCTYTTNPKLIKDNDGRLFKPSLAVYTKYDGVLRGDRVLIGESIENEPTSDAREVTTIRSAWPLMGAPDFDLFCG